MIHPTFLQLVHYTFIDYVFYDNGKGVWRKRVCYGSYACDIIYKVDDTGITETFEEKNETMPCTNKYIIQKLTPNELILKKIITEDASCDFDYSITLLTYDRIY